MGYRELAEQFMIDSFSKEPPLSPPADMSKGETGILTYLSFYRNNVLSGELSKELRLTSGRIATALKSLEKKGFIVRTAGIDDSRKVIVSATKEGILHANKQKDKALDDLTAIFEYIGEDDAKEFVRILRRIFGINSQTKD